MSDKLPMEGWITIGSFASVLNAEMVRGFLESNGVAVLFVDENVGRIASPLYPMIGGIKLQVRKEDAELARSLLAEAQGKQ